MTGKDKRTLVKIWFLVVIFVLLAASMAWVDVHAEAPTYDGAEHGNGRPPEHANAGGRSDKWNNDPDDDGNGPDRGDGSVDDWDWNNGCGNDADRSDDNEGWCGRPHETTPVIPPPERIPPSKLPVERRTCKVVLWGETPELFEAGHDLTDGSVEKFLIAEAHDYLEVVLPWGFEGEVLWYRPSTGHLSATSSFTCDQAEVVLYEPAQFAIGME